MNQKAVFLDRDGVINQKLENDYVKTWEEFLFLPYLFDALRILEELGFLMIVVTNQRCIAKGIISEVQLRDIHSRMMVELEKENVHIAGVYFCPHDDKDGCQCRKPKPGLILKALSDFADQGMEISLPQSYMIGDSESDILAGKNANLKTIKIGRNPTCADFVATSLFDAAMKIFHLFEV